MKKTLIALILATSTTAFAGDYTDANTKIAMCKIISEYSAHAFLGKEKGAPKPASIKDDDYLYALVKFAREYGYTRATTMEDAYMTTWAKCMDNADYLVQEYSTGRIATELLY